MDQASRAPQQVPPPADPVVSVIMPAYNTGRYIGEAIGSALAQTMADLELIVVDDGSTDDTAEVARGCAHQDQRVRLFVRPHGGIAKARNYAIAVARAPILAFLDSDDAWTPVFLARQLAILAKLPDVAIVSGNAIARGGPSDGQTYWPATSGFHRVSLLDIIEREDSISIMAVFRRQVIEMVGEFDESLGENEDYDLWLRAAHAGFGIIQSREPLALARKRSDSVSANQLRMLHGIMKVLSKTRAHCHADPKICAAIDRQLARFDRELLALQGKIALRSRDFRAAADAFRGLYRRQGGITLGLLAAVSRYMPEVLFWLDRHGRGKATEK